MGQCSNAQNRKCETRRPTSLTRHGFRQKGGFRFGLNLGDGSSFSKRFHRLGIGTQVIPKTRMFVLNPFLLRLYRMFNASFR